MIGKQKQIAACFSPCPTLVLQYEWRGLIQSNNTSGCFLFKLFVCGIFRGNSQLNVFSAISKCHISCQSEESFCGGQSILGKLTSNINLKCDSTGRIEPEVRQLVQEERNATPTGNGRQLEDKICKTHKLIKTLAIC